MCSKGKGIFRSEEHTSELQSRSDLVCRLLLEKKKSCKTRTKNCKRRLACSPSKTKRSNARMRKSSMPARSWKRRRGSSLFFFFKDPATTEIYTLSLHDALPISGALASKSSRLGTLATSPASGPES